jgi:hypothetical protein
MAKLKITKTEGAYGAGGQIHDRYTMQTQINSAYVGGTGGNTSQTGRQIQTVAKIGSTGTAGNSWIDSQKGIRKFRVENLTDGAGVCTLTNIATPTATNTMSIRMDLAELTGNITAANVAGGATSTYVTYAASSIVGPRALAAGDWIQGFASSSIGTYGAQITTINSTVAGLANVTVAVSGNVATQTAQSLTSTLYASRINNKYVYDFNGNKYRYHLALPDSTFIRVWYT